MRLSGYSSEPAARAALLAPEPFPPFLCAEGREKFGEPLASLLTDEGLDERCAPSPLDGEGGRKELGKEGSV